MFEDVHRYFLQFILKNSHIPVETALRFYSSLAGQTQGDSNGALMALVAEINEKISAQHLTISVTKCEVTGSSSLTLLNTANDRITKLQNAFSLVEVEYFQHLLNEIITMEDHKLQIMACYNLSHSTKFRKDNVEKFLGKCMQLGYLVEKDAHVYLGPRCIAEFSPYFTVYFKEHYVLCNLCSEAVFTGESCSSCKKMMHSYCIEKWLKKQNKCPHCKSSWEKGGNERNEMIEMQESSDGEH